MTILVYVGLDSAVEPNDRRIDERMLAAAEIRYVPTTDLDLGDDPHDYDTEDIELSLDVVGIIEPLSATSGLEVFIGKRRARASLRKGLSHVPVIIVDVDERTKRISSLVSNLCRHEVDDEYGAIAELVALLEQGSSQHGGDRKSPRFKAESSFHDGNLKLTPVQRAARILNLKKETVYRKLRIADKGTPELREALADDIFGENIADALCRKTRKEQKREVSKRRKEKGKKKARLTGLPVALHRAMANLKHFEQAVQEHRTDMPDEMAAEIERRLTTILKSVRSRPKRAVKKVQVCEDKETRQRAAKDAVRFEKITFNGKLAPGVYPERHAPYVCATDVSIAATCPDSCPLKDAPGVTGGCYAKAGITKGSLDKLDDAAYGLTAEEVIAAEAQKIRASFKGGLIPQDGARGGRDLRLHVSGDVGSEEGARLLADAAQDWNDRGGGNVFAYTHLWPTISREAFGTSISVLASVELPEDIEVATARGYAAALLVEDFPNGDKSLYLPDSTTKFIPCPAQTREGVTCASCRLCMDDQALLKRNAAIAFKIHGNHAKAAKESLVQLRVDRAKLKEPPVLRVVGSGTDDDQLAVSQGSG